jgi:hypothetical protein
VQLGEELDAILKRDQLIHYTTEMIATKAKGNNERQKKKSNFLFQKRCQKIVEKL